MEFSLDQRTASLSIGDFSAFALGPRDSVAGGGAGLWRAQLGTHWHNELRHRAVAEHAAAATFEIPITGRLVHRGWTIALTGRIDQVVRTGDTVVLREIKTVTRPLPADETELRRDYPDYFVQIATYAALARLGCLPPPSSQLSTLPPQRPVLGSQLSTLSSQLCFVETQSGLAQTVALTVADDALVRLQLERVAEFLDLRLRARTRLRGLRYRPAFAAPRPGQETTRADLTALFERRPLVFFEAPTGFGKTGVLLEFALGQLRAGHVERVLYLTGKSTGQLQVVRTLAAMTASPPPAAGESPKPKVESPPPPALPAAPLSALDSQLSAVPSARPSHPAPSDPSTFDLQPSTRDAPGVAPVAVWHVRNKSEHCVNHTFHCVRDTCAYLADAPARWPTSGLARFYLDEHHARDLDTLRAAGRAARICPYEITRAALAFNDVWIGDFNYVFAPRNRGLFTAQPGWDPARTLLLIDEAHNLPARVADAYSHAFSAAAAYATRDELHRHRVPSALATAWDHWCHFLHHLPANPGLDPAQEDDARHLLAEIEKHLRAAPLDFAALGPAATDALWSIPALLEDLSDSQFSALGSHLALPRLWWSPRDAELALTCLDAAPAIGATLRDFGGVVLASATLSPTADFAVACGLDHAARPPASVSPGASKTLPEGGGAASGRAEGYDCLSSPTAGPEVPPPLSSKPSPPPLPPPRLGALTKRETKKLFAQLTSGADLLRVAEAEDAAAPTLLRADAPWRDAAYTVAVDARVDTSFQHRAQHLATTAATIAALHAAAVSAFQLSTFNLQPAAASPTTAVAAFFPSYAYAESVLRELAAVAPSLRVALQPRVRDLAAQSAWVENALRSADALFLVLGSSFAEGIDALGGRVTHALVAGPALPEVNAVQKARLSAALAAPARSARPHRGAPGSALDSPPPAPDSATLRAAAFRRVYQLPGITRVNQALGRLVRAPGQRARVILHCRRFLDTTYADLLAPEYRAGTPLRSDADLAAWLAP